MNLALRYLFAGLAALGISLPAAASGYSIDYTDLWYNAPAESESGWGVNVIQQNETMFVTLFVYGSDGTPRWFVAPNVGPTTQTHFTGPLYSIPSGTYFGAPTWAGIGPVSQVGTITFDFLTATTGTLVYTVNGVVVTKNIVRQTWRADVLTGNYLGGLAAFGAGCSGNGDRSITGVMTVNHNNPTVSLFIDFNTGSGQSARCTYNGTYSQTGSLGTLTGNFTCVVAGSNANTGTFTVTEMRVTRNGFNGRLAQQDQFCSSAGSFGGIKDVF